MYLTLSDILSHPTCKPCWHRVGHMPGIKSRAREGAHPDWAALAVCSPHSLLGWSCWGWRGKVCFLPPAAAGRHWSSGPAWALLSAWAQRSHCRPPSDTCLDQPCLPLAGGSLTFNIFRHCGLWPLHVSAMQCCSRRTTENICGVLDVYTLGQPIKRYTRT